MPQTSLHDLIGRIYEASVEPEIWPDVLSQLAAVTKSVVVLLSLQLPGEAQSGRMFTTPSADPDYIESLNEYYWQHDPWRPFNNTAAVADIMLGRELVPRSELLKTEFYNDWMRPQKYLDTLALNLTPPRIESAIAACRKEGSDYEDEDIALVRELAPHFRRAAAVDCRLRSAERATSVLREALDRFPTGVCVLDAKGNVLQTNLAADRLLAGGDGLTIRQGRLVAARSNDARVMGRLMLAAAQTGNGHGLSAGGHIALERPSGRRPLSVTISPVRSLGAVAVDGRAAALVFIADPEEHVELRLDLLRQLWGLTRSEARVASLVAAGMSLEEISEKLSIQANTARAHLKQVFSKTDTGRQAELVSLLLRTLGGSRHDDET